jgi:hypothetical protein
MRVVLVLALSAGCAAVDAPERWTSRALPDCDAAFLPQKSLWRGGDAAYSVPLSHDRVLWLFGDTFIAAPGGVGRPGSRMVRNTLAIQKLPEGPQHYWRTEAGQPADAFKPAAGDGWLWPLSGVRVGPILHLFMFQMVAKDGGAFGFAFSKSVLLTVDNPDEEPASWRTRQLDIPHSLSSAKATIFFGGASVVHDGTLFIYGVRELRNGGPGGKSILAARVDALAIDDFSAWRFFSGADWSPDSQASKELYSGGSIEMSVSPFKDGFAAVYTRVGMSPEILVRRAPKPEGPWGDPVVVFRCPETEWNKTYFCYAAKAHPELASGHRELLVSYACNSTNFGDAVRDLRIYRPRFVRIALE